MPRSKVAINWEYVQKARLARRSWVDIALDDQVSDLGPVSERTLANHRVEVGWVDPLVTPGDNELQEFVYKYTQRNPYQGETQIQAAVAAQGWNVTREKVREVIHLVDPEGVERRTFLPSIAGSFFLRHKL